MTDHIPAPYFPANLEEYAPWVTEHGLRYPYGQCQCGCGQAAPIQDGTFLAKGYRKGHPARFLPGHNKAKDLQIENPNPSGLCMCGCGQKTPIADRNRKLLGWVKGQPIKYIVGHGGVDTRKRPLLDKFWEHVDKRSDDECWLWTGRKNRQGYGILSEYGRNIRAHRLSYEIHNGPLLDGMAVCHQCDTPACVNPHHLWLGTLQDNNADRAAKGRTISGRTYGEDHALAKLTAAQVVEIRRRCDAGEMLQTIADDYGISDSNVLAIKQRKTWKHVP